MKKRYAGFIKDFADGHRVLVLPKVFQTEWREATSPHEIASADCVRYAVETIEYRRYVYRAGRAVLVFSASPGLQKDLPREGLAGFVEWIDTAWLSHEVRLPKGPAKPHAEIIKAWADGAKLRWAHYGGPWIYEGEALVPLFCPSYTYEVAPEAVRYRRAIYTSIGTSISSVVAITEGKGEAPAAWQRSMERLQYTVHWIDTEWQTAEVPHNKE